MGVVPGQAGQVQGEFHKGAGLIFIFNKTILDACRTIIRCALSLGAGFTASLTSGLIWLGFLVCSGATILLACPALIFSAAESVVLQRSI